MQFPSQVNIGPFTYSVKLEDDLWWHSTGNDGETDYATRTIHVHQDTDQNQTADTFLHECMHCMYQFMRLADKGQEEEETVARLSTALILFFKQNPEVLDIFYEL
jgi:hypothetical protein